MGILQKKIFVNCEGNNFFKRNSKNLTNLDFLKDTDEIIKYFIASVPSVRNVLEIGCSNGGRLQILKEIYKCKCYGVEPSQEAINYGKKHYRGIKFILSTADDLPFSRGSFDHVIIGFCLYLCDREDLFKIAYEVDRVLIDGGNLYILDWSPPFAYRRRYAHSQGVYSYKMDYSKLFLWNPFYTLIYQKKFTALGKGLLGDDTVHHMDNPEMREAVSVLKKYKKGAYPLSPFKLFKKRR